MARFPAIPMWLAGPLLGASLGACSGTIVAPQDDRAPNQGATAGTRATGGTSGTSGEVRDVGVDPERWFKEGDPLAAPALPLRLITQQEYDNTIAVIFSDEYGVIPPGLQPGKVLPGETVDLSVFSRSARSARCTCCATAKRPPRWPPRCARISTSSWAASSRPSLTTPRASAPSCRHSESSCIGAR